MLHTIPCVVVQCMASLFYGTLPAKQRALCKRRGVSLSFVVLGVRYHVHRVKHQVLFFYVLHSFVFIRILVF